MHLENMCKNFSAEQVRRANASSRMFHIGKEHLKTELSTGYQTQLVQTWLNHNQKKKIKLFNFGEFSNFLKYMSFPVIPALNISIKSTQTNRIHGSNEVFQW